MKMLRPLIKYGRQTPCRKHISMIWGEKVGKTGLQCRQSTPGSECASGLCSDWSHKSTYTHLVPNCAGSTPFCIREFRSRISLATVDLHISLCGTKRSQSQRARCCFTCGSSTTALRRGTMCCSEKCASWGLV